jgi:hypothetical protein
MRLRMLIAVATIGLGAVSTASASEFLASGLGSLSGTGGMQQFSTSAGKVVCEKQTTTGAVTALSSKTLDVTTKYSECEGFGSKVVVSPASYEFNSEESVSVIGPPIVITNATGKCSIKIAPGGANSGLESTVYFNTAKHIMVQAEVFGVNYTPSGGICGTSKSLETNGTYSGTSTIELVGGTIQAEKAAGILIRPAKFKFKAVGSKQVFKIINNSLGNEKVEKGGIKPAEAKFTVVAGKGCYEAKFYLAGASCSVTIEALAKGTETFEIVPLVFPVATATLEL